MAMNRRLLNAVDSSSKAGLKHLAQESTDTSARNVSAHNLVRYKKKTLKSSQYKLQRHGQIIYWVKTLY